MAILRRLKGLFRRPAPPSELDQQRSRLRVNLSRIEALETKNRLAYSASRLEYLEARGTPVYQPPRLPQETPARLPVLSYVKDQQTGYPFAAKVEWLKTNPALRHEQDPLFGYALDPFAPCGLYDWGLGGGFGVNSFPREMFPDRPSSLRTQIAQDAVRLMSRLWFETVPQYAGPIGHLRNYCLGEGMSVEVTSEKDPELAQDVQEWLDEFCKQNKFYRLVYNSVLNLFRDGESAVHIVPNGEYPKLRSVDTSWIRGPRNEVQGPWSFGVLTHWPDDFEEPLAYHLWNPANQHYDVSPKLLKLAKLDTVGGNVKRGVPLAYKIRKQLPQLGNLLDAMAVGEAARQSIPYIQQYANADQQAVRDSLPSIFDEPEERNFNFRTGHGEHSNEILPGRVPHINKGQEYQAPPQGAVHQGTDAYRALCEAVACALNVPLWFCTGTADAENYSSSLVSESPLVKLVQHYQQVIKEHWEEILKSVVEMAVGTGKFTPAVWETCQLHCELPSPVPRNRKEEIEIGLQLLDKKLISPQTLCEQNNLDFTEQQDLLKQAEASGWQHPADAYAEMVSESGGLRDGEEQSAATSQEERDT